MAIECCRMADWGVWNCSSVVKLCRLTTPLSPLKIPSSVWGPCSHFLPASLHSLSLFSLTLSLLHHFSTYQFLLASPGVAVATQGDRTWPLPLLHSTPSIVSVQIDLTTQGTQKMEGRSSINLFCSNLENVHFHHKHVLVFDYWLTAPSCPV